MFIIVPVSYQFNIYDIIIIGHIGVNDSGQFVLPTVIVYAL